MNGPIDDKAFEEYLKRGSPVSQQYQALESDEIPGDVDRRILARAEEAVRPSVARKTRAWQRWSIPVGLAASAVLAFSIVMESGQHESTLTRAPSYAEPARDMSSASHELEEHKAESSVEPQAVELAAAPNAAREEARSGAATRERESEALREEGQRRSAARAVAPPPPTEVLAKRAVPETEPSVALDTREDRALVERRVDELNDQAMQTAARAPTRPAFAPRAAPLDVQRPSQAPTSATVENPGFISQQGQEQARHADPDGWLREIRELRAAGKKEEADREWKAFRETFPDHAVAEDDPAIGM